MADVRVVLAPLLDLVLVRGDALELLVPPLGGRTPPFCATDVRKGTERPAVEANRSSSPSVRRGDETCVRITM